MGRKLWGWLEITPHSAYNVEWGLVEAEKEVDLSDAFLFLLK